MGLPAVAFSGPNRTRRGKNRIVGERLTLGLVFEEAVNLGSGTVEGTDGETVISSVEDQVLAHNGQTDEAKISTGNRVHRCADIDAGETGTIVSDRILLSIAR